MSKLPCFVNPTKPSYATAQHQDVHNHLTLSEDYKDMQKGCSPIGLEKM